MFLLVEPSSHQQEICACDFVSGRGPDHRGAPPRSAESVRGPEAPLVACGADACGGWPSNAVIAFTSSPRVKAAVCSPPRTSTLHSDHFFLRQPKTATSTFSPTSRRN